MKKLQWGEYLLVHARNELDPNLVWASKGFPTFDYLCEDKLNVYDLLKAHRVVLTKAAAQAITMRLTIGTEKTNADNTRFLVGTYGGGYNADQVHFVRYVINHYSCSIHTSEQFIVSHLIHLMIDLRLT